MSTLAERIYEIRSLQNLNQTEFANIIGITQTSLSQLEASKNNPSFEVLVSISQKFNINYAWLIEGIGKMQKTEISAIEKLNQEIAILKKELADKNYTIETQKELLESYKKTALS